MKKSRHEQRSRHRGGETRHRADEEAEAADARIITTGRRVEDQAEARSTKASMAGASQDRLSQPRGSGTRSNLRRRTGSAIVATTATGSATIRARRAQEQRGEDNGGAEDEAERRPRPGCRTARRRGRARTRPLARVGGPAVGSYQRLAGALRLKAAPDEERAADDSPTPIKRGNSAGRFLARKPGSSPSADHDRGEDDEDRPEMASLARISSCTSSRTPKSGDPGPFGFSVGSSRSRVPRLPATFEKALSLREPAAFIALPISASPASMNLAKPGRRPSRRRSRGCAMKSLYSLLS